MSIFNKPGDAALGHDGKVRVNRQIVGVWRRHYLEKGEKHFYSFALAEKEEPILTAYFCHLFRAVITDYLLQEGLLRAGANGKHKWVGPSIAANSTTTSRSEPVGEIDEYERARRERKAKGASYGHVTRRLRQREPLTGKTLEIALSIVGDGKRGDKTMDDIASKIEAGQPLNDYELHIMVDMLLPHARLG